MMEIEKCCKEHDLSLIGHCTDSASNSLNALIWLATPQTYKHCSEEITFLGLDMKGFVFFASVAKKYPSIAYPSIVW